MTSRPEAPQAPATPATPDYVMPGRLEFVTMMAMLTAMVAFSIDGMMPALPEIASDLSPDSPNAAQLVLTTFVLGLGIGTLFTGPLSDRFGRKPVIVAGVAVYVLAALASVLTVLGAVVIGFHARMRPGRGARAMVLGAGLGSLTAASIQGPMLQKIIGVFAIVIAIQMALDLKPRASRAVPSKLGLTAAGGVIGWASAIFGIGGGTLNVPFLTWRSLPMQQAVATSSACGLPIAVASALSFMLIGWSQPQLPEWSLGYVYLPAMVGIAFTSMFFARFGARLAHKLSPRLLKRLFALLLLCVGVSFLV